MLVLYQSKLEQSNKSNGATEAMAAMEAAMTIPAELSTTDPGIPTGKSSQVLYSCNLMFWSAMTTFCWP